MSYSRIMLKLSGEALSGSQGVGFDQETLADIAEQIQAVADAGTQVAIVVGGGNIWRFRDNKDVSMPRTASDAIGMTATVINGATLCAALESLGASACTMSTIDVPELTEPFVAKTARKHLEEGTIVICTGGTGNPYFTTDSAAALRALQLDCDILLKATNVDGVYDKDPNEHSDAVKYDELTFDAAIAQNLNVLDQTAFSLCREHNLSIQVFDLFEKGSLEKVASGERIGSIVRG